MATRPPGPPQSASRLVGLSGNPAMGVLQLVIHKGKTYNSKPIGLKLSNWYKSLKDDDHKNWAIALHKDPNAHYTTQEALDEIESRLAKGEKPPDPDEDEKEKRKKRVREWVNANAPDETSDEYIRGNVLATASQHGYKRHARKYRRTGDYKSSTRIVADTKPGLFNDQKKILPGSEFTPWQQVFAVTESKPKTYNFNLGGSEVTLDSLDLKSNEEREKERPQTSINLGQFFIEQPGSDNSYWKMSDSTDTTLASTRQHQQLRHLEVERENLSAFTTYLKDDLFEFGTITNQQAFGDENLFTFQEYKGALKPTSTMRRVQRASASRVLERAITDANRMLGSKVKKRPQTTAGKINAALDEFMKDRTTAKYKLLVKEIYRLIRSKTKVDLDSDTEGDSDDDMPK
jgi:hypothetical protein